MTAPSSGQISPQNRDQGLGSLASAQAGAPDQPPHDGDGDRAEGEIAAGQDEVEVGNPAPPIPRNSASFSRASTPSQSFVAISARNAPYFSALAYGSEAHPTRACCG